MLIVMALIDLLTNPMTTPADMQSFLGSVQWIMLANRQALMLFSAIYSFSLDLNCKVVKRIPDRVLQELALFSSLLCTLVIDLRRDWDPHFHACDGAPSYGYGGARVSADPSAVP